jgi:hypothetical protein
MLTVGVWLNAALLAAVLVGLVTRDDTGSLLPAALGQMQVEAAAQGGGAVKIVPAQLASGSWGCYVLDIQTRHLTVYQYHPGERQLRLVAARDVQHDLNLNDFNTAPSPREISQLVEIQQAGRPQRPE